MKAIPWRTQLALVAASYAAALVVGAGLVFMRYMLYVKHPDEAIAASGMYAFGDWMLELFIGGLFLIPTLFLVFVIAKSETIYTGYSKVLLALSLTAPISFGLLSIPAVSQGTSMVGFVCLGRLMAFPFAVIGLGISWWMARFPRPRRLISYALLLEILTFVLMIALLFLSVRRG